MKLNSEKNVILTMLPSHGLGVLKEVKGLQAVTPSG